VIPHFGKKANVESVAIATQQALQAADDRGLQSIAFPALGTGAARFEAEKCAETMVSMVLQHIRSGKSSLRQVIFVVLPATKEPFTDQMVRRLGGQAQLDRLSEALAASDNPHLRQAGAALSGGASFLTADWPAAAAFLRDLAGVASPHPAVRETMRYCWAVWQTELCHLLAQPERDEARIAALRRQIGALETANPTVF
jgi:hypothetical protein